MQPINWKRNPVSPEDILDGLKSIGSRYVWRYSQIPDNWQAAETIYEWASLGISNDHEFGWDIAVSYAKRAVCRRIDGFLLNNWLGHFGRRKYPEKLDILRKIGIPVPNIVQRLVIGNRNELEHDYKSVSREDATDAIELAALMMNATMNEVEREPAVMVSNTICASSTIKSSEPKIESHGVEGLGAEPLLFVDFLVDPVTVKLVYPIDEEYIFAELKNFSLEEAIAFANRMRSFRKSGFPFIVTAKHLEPTIVRFRQFKQQTGI